MLNSHFILEIFTVVPGVCDYVEKWLDKKAMIISKFLVSQNGQ